jgi:hypothetical protein
MKKECIAYHPNDKSNRDPNDARENRKFSKFAVICEDIRRDKLSVSAKIFAITTHS